MKLSLLINMKMPTLSYLLAEKVSCSAELSMKKGCVQLTETFAVDSKQKQTFSSDVTVFGGR